MSKLEEKIEELEGTIQERVEKKANAVENKLGLDKDEVYMDYLSEKEYLTEKYEDRDESTLNHQAWVRIKTKWNRELNSDADMFEGFIVGAGTPFDAVKNRRKTAKKVFEENPEKAIEEGLTDEEGNPLDNRKKFRSGGKNPNYGDKLPEHNWLRQIIGVYTKVGSDQKPKKFWMTLRGDNATSLDLPIMEAVRFRGNEADAERDGVQIINSIRDMRFNVFDSDDIKPEIAIDMFSDDFVNLEDVKDINENKLGYDELYATEGWVEYVPTRTPDDQNMRISISNDELGMEQYTVWLPDHLKKYVDFEVGSKVWVFGHIRTSMYNDEKTYQVNAWGLYPYPEFRINDNESGAMDGQDFAEVY